MLGEIHRLYNCGCCGEQVRICRRCDRGNIYCAGECAVIRRRESLGVLAFATSAATTALLDTQPVRALGGCVEHKK